MAATSGVNTTAFDALADDTATAVENVNAKIATVSDLTSDASKNIFSTTQVLADQVKTAAAAEASSAGSGSSSITFTDSAAVSTAASNKAPTDISLSASTISEAASSLVIGTLSTTDSDQTAGVKPTYTLAEIAGSDYALFTIDQSTGELSLKAQPDFETKETYSVTILSTDEGGKTFSKTFSISIGDVNEAPTVANAIADQTIAEDSALSFQFASNVFADVDTGDSFTYTATLEDGSDLPDWLSFDEVTRTFSGTPSNADVGVIGVKVTATDSGSAAVSDTFNLTVTNTSDAAISFEVDLNATNGLGQIIDQDLTTFGSKLSNFYNDSDSGINNILDGLNSEEFGQTDDQIKISSNGISISNADGYILSLEFSNFSPASLAELEELAYNFDGTIEKFEISGGFKAIALSDPDGNKMIELSHSAEGIAWRNLRANDDEISTFMIEGDFENQIANYKSVLTELSELDTVETEPNTQDELDAIASLVEITGVSARDASGDIFSVRLRSNDDNEDSAEISLKGAENTHIFALGATGVTAFISGLLELDGDGSAFELFTASDELYAGYSIRYENGDSFYQHNTADGSWQYYDIDGKQANPSYDPIGVKEPKWLDLSELPDTDINDVVTYYIGTNYYYDDLANNETTQDKYNARIAEMQAVFKYTEGNKDAQELFGLNFSYEYGGVDVFSTNINSIDWVKFNQTDNIENNLDLSQGLQFLGFDDGSDREITLIIDESDIVDLKLLGVNKDDFEETYIASNNDLVLAIGEYTDFLDFFSDDYIEQDIA